MWSKTLLCLILLLGGISQISAEKEKGKKCIPKWQYKCGDVCEVLQLLQLRQCHPDQAQFPLLLHRSGGQVYI